MTKAPRNMLGVCWMPTPTIFPHWKRKYLWLCTGKTTKGVRFAKRLANTDGGSYASIGGAIEILFKVNDKRLRSTLKKLMTKALAVKEEATLYDLEDFVHIATVHLNDVEMAVQFAQQLYANFKNTSLEALKLCSMAFYNVGNLAMAQEAAFNLLRAVPEDCYAKVLCDYLKQNRPEEELTHFDSSARVFRHFFVPYKLLYFAGTQCYKYLQMPADSQTSEKLMFHIEPIIYNSKAMFLAGKSEEYYENLPFVAQVLGAFPLRTVTIGFCFPTVVFNIVRPGAWHRCLWKTWCDCITTENCLFA